ncbi:MAG: hypothetical protein DHS20C02_01570 [Micavibrio sp.]|nr:MAG: hypothetical protein DHS20C02_01570 [Micavibrio sp.]
MRTGEHEGYSRLVFDWKKRVDYEADTSSKGRLVLTFKKDALVNTTGMQVGDKSNILAFEILSQSPLKISLAIPEGSRTRNFHAGERLVVDIYDPSGGKPKSQFQASRIKLPPPSSIEPPPEAKAQAPKKVAKIELKPPEKKEEVKKAEEKKTPEKKAEKAPEKPAEPVKPVEKAEALKVEHKEPLPVEVVEKEKLDDAKPDDAEVPSLISSLETADGEAIPPHVITITSTKNVGVSVFENYGELWLATDKDEFYLKPQINGPTPEIFPPFKEQKLGDDSKAYATKIPPGSNARGQGGGLLWRVVVSAEENKKHPVNPIREFEHRDAVRGGTLVWPFEEPAEILEFVDSISGDTLILATTGSSKDFAGPGREFVDFETLPSHIGLVIRSKVDDLEVRVTGDGIEVSRPGGLALASEQMLAMARDRKTSSENEKEGTKRKKPAPRIYSFSEWQMGGVSVMDQNENIILAGMNETPDGEKIENLITLARMYLSNGRAAEALGFIAFAQEELPELESNPDFLALRGVAHAMSWNSEEAFNSLSIESLKPFEEVNYWRAYALADLADWQQAYQVMPADTNTLYDYPEAVRSRLALVLSEVALRAGNIDMGEDLLVMVEEDKDKLEPPFKAALQYLKGEAARQAGNTDETKKLWKALSKGKDDLYRAKAGLALTRLQRQEGDITLEKAIDNLERLRYAWRGDQLEASIAYWLGRTYFDAKDYIKGLNIMREATGFSAGTRLGRRITEEMTEAFTDLYIGPHLNDVSPLDAVALYEQFSELTPAGPKGDKVVENLAERLVQADLLDRAGDLLKHQIEHRLKGDEAARVAVRLAAIRLLAAQPDYAMPALDKATAVLRTLPEEIATPMRYSEISLLRARAFSQDKKPDQALAILNGMDLTPDVNRLRADIAWKAAYWDDAAEALGDVILDRDISLTRPLKDEDATFILHRAISLNLASDRIALANMREKYADPMAQTEKARLFEVVTRPRQNAALADRQTLLSIVSEVDMFEGFLDSYRGSQKPSN